MLPISNVLDVNISLVSKAASGIPSTMGLITRRGLLGAIGLINLLTWIGVFIQGTEGLSFQGGTSKSYARFPKWNACVNASISFEFKTLEGDGLLMYTDDKGKYDFFEVCYIGLFYNSVFHHVKEYFTCVIRDLFFSIFICKY